MAIIVAIIYFLLCFSSAFGQSIFIAELDSTRHPEMRAKVYVTDKNGKQIVTIPIADFFVTENGEARKILSVSSPTRKPALPLSSVLTVDVSQSMKGAGLQIAKAGARAWVEGLSLGRSECAVTSFDDKSYINQDFTTDQTRLFGAINSLNPQGGTDYDYGLIRQFTGALAVAKNGKHKKTVVFMTDGNSVQEPQVRQIIAEAERQNCTIYCIALGMNCPLSLKEISEQTAGKWYEQVDSEEKMLSVIREILMRAQENEAHGIVWESVRMCGQETVSAKIGLTSPSISAKTEYQPPAASFVKLEFSPAYLTFKNAVPGKKTDLKVKVTARNADISISKIAISNPDFSLNKSNFSLSKDQSTDVIVSFTPSDSGYAFAKFSFETNLCSPILYASGGSSRTKPRVQTLKLIQPNGGEQLVVGSDTEIQWEGIPDFENVQLDYSTDNGVSWDPIAASANGFRYLWKNIPKPAKKECRIRVRQGTSSGVGGKIGDMQLNLAGHSNSVAALAWSPDATKLATASWDKTAMIWNSLNGALLLTLKGHEDNVVAVAWSPDGKRVATASLDKTVITWNAKTGEKIFTLQGHTGWVYSVNWSPDGSKLATASWDKTAIIWDAENGVKIQTLTGHSEEVVMVHWSPDGTKLATASWDKAARIWDIATTATLSHTLIGHTGDVMAITWSPDGTKLATASYDGSAIIWDAGTGESRATLRHSSYVYAVNWSPDSKRVATASDDETAIIWDAGTGDKIFLCNAHSDAVYDVAWSPDGTRIATASDDSTAIMWSATSGARLFTLRGHTSYVWAISWSSDGTRIATGSGDGTCKTWIANISEMQTDESDQAFSIVEPKAEIKTVDMGKCLVGATSDFSLPDFIRNSGAYPFRVDSIFFSGADASAFSIISGTPKYVVNSGESKFAEFRFFPKSQKLYQATINLVTQSDTLRTAIIGQGVPHLLEIQAATVDFGQLELGKEMLLQGKVMLKNISSFPVFITNVVQLGPDKSQFEILTGGGTFTLAPNEERKMTLRFRPVVAGRTSGRIAFEFNGIGSPAIAELWGTGLGRLVSVANDSAYIGETKDILLRLNQPLPEEIAAAGTNFEALLTFQKSIIAPVAIAKTELSNDTTFLTVKGQTGRNLELARIPVKVGLGSVDYTSVDIISLQMKDNAGGNIGYNFEFQSGLFSVLGICEEGGKRLLNTDNSAELMRVSPNPSNGKICVSMNIVERGVSILRVLDPTGKCITERNFDGNAQKLEMEIESEFMSNGLYFVSLQTPTMKKTIPIIMQK